MRKKLLGFYNYTVILTYVGMLCGFFGIAFAVENEYRHAIVCLMIAGLCDMFDGAVASTRQRTESEKRFGIQIDSLSDLICFGVLPALITYCICRKTPVSFGVSCLYLLCALIRLAYFNVMEEVRQTQESGCRSNYQGLPVTTSALVFPVFFLVGCRFPGAHSVLTLISSVLMAFAFLSPFRVRKPHLFGKIIMMLLGLTEFAIMLLGARFCS